MSAMWPSPATYLLRVTRGARGRGAQCLRRAQERRPRPQSLTPAGGSRPRTHWPRGPSLLLLEDSGRPIPATLLPVVYGVSQDSSTLFLLTATPLRTTGCPHCVPCCGGFQPFMRQKPINRRIAKKSLFSRTRGPEADSPGPLRWPAKGLAPPGFLRPRWPHPVPRARWSRCAPSSDLPGGRRRAGQARASQEEHSFPRRHPTVTGQRCRRHTLSCQTCRKFRLFIFTLGKLFVLASAHGRTPHNGI